MRSIILSLLLLCVATITNSQQPAFVTDSLDQYVPREMKAWDLPGLAIVVVKDGKVVVMKGYGVRDLSTGDPVDENTLFMIASNTKLFTGTSLSQLAYWKKLSLNDKISKYFPDYKLFDPLASESVTIRDMLCHRLGTKTFQGDFTFWNSHLSRSEIMHRMRLLKPVGLFRQDYGYCNSCFLTAGQVIPKVTGKEWQDYVRDSILAPLDMKRTTTISHGMESQQNVARPYTTSFTGKLNRVPYDEWDNLGPAASIISNVNDLSHWLFFQLDSGRYHGSQVMPFAVLQNTRDVNIITSSRKSPALPMHFRGYGLGLFVADYNGRQIYWHTGGAGGMVSNVCFVPEENLGIAILTNNDNQSLFEALRYQLLDAFLGVPYLNRSQQFIGNFRSGMADQLKEIDTWKARIGKQAPPLPISTYTGEYTNEIYGSISIRQQEGHLSIQFNSHDHLSAKLFYLDHDEWLLQYDNVEYGLFLTKFATEGNQVKSLRVKANDFVEYDPYIFNKK